MLAPARTAKRRFQLVLIKPSHYDDDGYVVQWRRSSIPSNSLACVYSLAADAAGRRVLGSEVEIEITALDETNTRIKPKDIIDLIRRHDGFGMVGLVGVQSNQYPRALDIARPLRAAGLPVVIGGFHVSGLLAMLPGAATDLQLALDLGCSLFAGEAEGRIDRVLQDAAAATLKPVYNFMDDLPSLEAVPSPYLPRDTVRRVFDNHASFDAGRGCPFQCSFCTIINVQGRKSRRRSPDDIEQLIKRHWADGIRRFFITDDNFARNKDWEQVFDRLIKIREEDKIDIRLIIQVDTLCHKIPNFIEKARRAGVTRVFIGLENINPANLLAAKKRQNKITEYRKMLLGWKHAGIITYAGYILGFPGDTPQSILEDIAIIKKELPLDILEFFCLTPLPGSEDHKTLWSKGVWMDPDMNKYDLNHRVSHHSKMSDAEWEDAYRAAWAAYYTPEHVRTILRRSAACRIGRPGTTLTTILWFYLMIAFEGVHPLEGGALRLKFRRDRRHGMRRENPLVFYPRYVGGTLVKAWRYWRVYKRFKATLEEVLAAPDRWTYTDIAIAPPRADEFDALDLYHATSGGEAALARMRRDDEIRGTSHAPVTPAVAAE